MEKSKIPLATIRIPEPILDMVKDAQRNLDCLPVKSNDSLLISIACYTLINEGYLTTQPNKFKNDILEYIKMMIKDNLINKKTKGYRKI